MSSLKVLRLYDIYLDEHDSAMHVQHSLAQLPLLEELTFALNAESDQHPDVQIDLAAFSSTLYLQNLYLINVFMKPDSWPTGMPSLLRLDVRAAGLHHEPTASELKGFDKLIALSLTSLEPDFEISNSMLGLCQALPDLVGLRFGRGPDLEPGWSTHSMQHIQELQDAISQGKEQCGSLRFFDASAAQWEYDAHSGPDE